MLGWNDWEILVLGASGETAALKTLKHVLKNKHIFQNRIPLCPP